MIGLIKAPFCAFLLLDFSIWINAMGVPPTAHPAIKCTGRMRGEHAIWYVDSYSTESTSEEFKANSAKPRKSRKFKIGTTVTYECLEDCEPHEGFNEQMGQNDQYKITCQEEGNWSGEPLNCVCDDKIKMDQLAEGSWGWF